MFESIADAVQKLLSPNIVVSLLIIVITVFILIASQKASKRYTQRIAELGYSKTRERIVRHGTIVVRYIVLAIAVLAVLSVNGIDITAIAAAAGVAGIVIGFALQDILADLAMGLRVVTDGYFSVGQVISNGGDEGTVLAMSPQSTKIKSTKDDSVITISNRLLTRVTVLSEVVDLDIPMPYELSMDEVRQLTDEIAERAKALESVTDVRYIGIQEFAEAAAVQRMRIWCDPARHNQVLRDSRVIAKEVLNAHGHSIPYPHVDIQSV